MTDGEKDLLRLFQNYTFNEQRLQEAEERLRSKTYRITPSYSSTGGSGGGNNSRSRVENHAEKVLKLKREIEDYRRKIDIVRTALQCPELSGLEWRTLNWIANGGQLASFAEVEEIYISRIYKIRDKALRKALRSLETTKRSKNRVKY
jgi:hypothetical protein